MRKDVLKWCLQMAHDDLERVKSEFNKACARAKWCSERMVEAESTRDAARKEVAALRVEREALRAELADANARLAEQPTGWRQFGAHWIHTDGRWIESHADDCYIGVRADGSYGHSGCSSREAAQEAEMCGWSDFPGATDHSAGDP